MITGQNIVICAIRKRDVPLLKKWYFTDIYSRMFNPITRYSSFWQQDAMVIQTFKEDKYFIIKEKKNYYPIGFVHIFEQMNKRSYGVEIFIGEKSTAGLMVGPEVLFTISEWLVEELNAYSIRLEILSTNQQMLRFLEILKNYFSSISVDFQKVTLHEAKLENTFFAYGQLIDTYYLTLTIHPTKSEEKALLDILDECGWISPKDLILDLYED